MTTPGKNESFYRSTLNNLFGEDFNTILQVNEDTGEEEEISLDEIEMTEELFSELVKSKFESEKETIKKNSISTEGVSDFAKKLVEIDKQGGEIADLVKMKAEILDPLEAIDRDTLEGQKQVIAWRLKANNMEDEEVLRLLRSYESEGILADKAEGSYSDLRSALDKQLEVREQETKVKLREAKEALKEYKKSFSTSLKDSFELNDKVREKIVKVATKEKPDGGYDLDAEIENMRANPEQAAMLALFVLDREEYNKQISKGKLREDKLKNANTLRIIKKSAKTPQDTIAKENKGRIDLNQLM